ncbi:MAG TPA: phosphatidylserine/phosphatidylglycerophosphate/cardiolipin synthase family protein [Candidatus Polarisedimenticolaceae bacterium]|nr:phosphatidylserine/phosphatidylglycerophosphate/cardiolipin synthase family protein [Candidatus Polarisedimenticolaceae bacterium]
MRRGLLAAAVLTWSLLAASLARADNYLLLDRDEDAAQVRIDLIRGAHTSIDATYFIVGKDGVALSVLAELRAAVRRGVAVRMIVDAPFNSIPLNVRAALRRDGVELQEYHPFRLWKPSWWGRRMHDKLLIVDGVHLVTGGRNLDAAYFGLKDEEGSDAPRDYVDRDAYVSGPAAARAQAYFDQVWSSKEVRRAKLGKFRPRSMDVPCEEDDRRCLERKARLVAEVDEGARQLDERYRALDTVGVVRRDVVEPLVFAGTDVGPVTFLHDPVGKKDSEDGIGAELFAMMDGTQTSMLLESPWLVPSRALRKSFDRALARGVQIRVLTNSWATTDSLMTHAGYLRFRKGLAKKGIELWEYAGPGCLHSKTGVLDDRKVMIGSFNLDPRSEHFNSEVAIVFDQQAAAAKAREPLDDRLGKAVRIGANGKPVPGPVTLPKMPMKRKIMLGLARIVAIFVHRQL